MLKLTSEILADLDYVAECGGAGHLLDQIERIDFAHFGGRPKLQSMLDAYRANPDWATWREYDCNVQVMIDLAKPKDADGGPPRTSYRQRAIQAEMRVEQLTQELDEMRTRCDEQAKRIEELLQQNGELRGQLVALESRAR